MFSTQYQGSQYHCKNEHRRSEVRKRRDADGLPILNGIDYLEVGADRRTIFVVFLHPIQKPLTLQNLRIYRQVEQTRFEVTIDSASVSAKQLTLGITPPTATMGYTLQLVEALGSNKIPVGFDSQLSQIEFHLDNAAQREFDCKSNGAADIDPMPPPVIDYLAKDYSSFRQLMLDRLAVTLPRWTERSPADLGMMLVELLAYKADALSYFQDAIATEAYLGTARKRVSIRRHARLLNYFVHDGCNARTWVVLQVKQSIGLKPQNQPMRFLTRVPGLPAVLKEEDFKRALNQGAIVFESLEALKLEPALNRISFYPWSDFTCVLPVGATAATLVDRDGELAKQLDRGRVLLFEEIKGAKNGEPADADPARRHAVRLTQVEAGRDELEDLSLVNIQWSQEDALPFPLTLTQIVDDNPISDITIARGNVILADHGRTIAPTHNLNWLAPNRASLEEEPLTQQARSRLKNASDELVMHAFGANWRQRWGDRPPFDPAGSAASAFRWKLHRVMPAIIVTETDPSTQKVNTWYPQRDLLNSDRTAREFVVETEDDGRAHLRFGDGQLGRAPQADAIYQPTYRIGNGVSGNIGAESLTHLFLSDQSLVLEVSEVADGAVRNPIAAIGGVEPEPIEQVQLYAPQAFRTLQRAVTESDYGEIVQRFPGVSKALATRQWTGSWYTIFITVDREGGLPVDLSFQHELTEFLEPYRLTGQDIKIESPRFVPLDLALQVFVKEDYFKAEVKGAILAVLSDRVLSNRQLGFFHPDRFTFADPVYLSQIIEKVMKVAGVRSVTATRFQRLGLPAAGELAAGAISIGRLEIALLDMDNPPNRGRLELIMEGGL
jgi:hypothetical protein